MRRLALIAIALIVIAYQPNTAGSEQDKKLTTQTIKEPKTESGAVIAPEIPPEVLFFTSYNVGDPKQNDATPCHGASGKDLCAAIDRGERPVAITKDVRTRYGLKFGDKVKLTGTCPGIYTVEDEMGPRFRKYCIKNQ